ncbi:MAG: DUF4159 domain-containing protein [Elusimicrobiota bacterium]
MKKQSLHKKIIIAGILFISMCPVLLGQGQGNKFVLAQLKYSGNWDPYPGMFEPVYKYLTNTTSINMIKERRIITLNDNLLFYSPFLLFTGRGSYPEFSAGEIENLRRYIRGGGILFIDTAGDEAFSKSVDRTIEKVFPSRDFTKIPNDSAVFKSFYLIDFVSGRDINVPYLEGIKLDSRFGIIKSDNDLPGVWPRDRAGNFKYDLLPGKLSQRKEALKLTLNILIYSVSGTYKTDPVHRPHIERKKGR